MSDADREQPAVYQRVLEGIAAESAALTERRDELREWLRDDPTWTWARHELAEETGGMIEHADILKMLHTRYDARSFDAEEFAQELWRMHIRSNERRSDATGVKKRYSKGAHHASSVALDVVRDVTGLEYEDYAGDRQEVGV